MNASSTLADLTASCRRATGEIPPPLVGVSTTILGNHLYVFGGRLVPRRVLVADMYALNLSTLVWQKVWPPAAASTAVKEAEPTRASSNDILEELDEGLSGSQPRGPLPRYFHSANAHEDSIYIFGGMGYQPSSSRPQSPAGSVSSRTSKASRNSKSSRKSAEKQAPAIEEEPQFCVLADLVVFNTVSRTWSFPAPPVAAANDDASTVNSTALSGPSARYAHLSVTTNNCLVIIGGQDMSNRYLEEVSVLDLERMTWIETRRFEGHCGTYRSVATARPLSIHSGQDASKRRSLLHASVGNADDISNANATDKSKHVAKPSTASLATFSQPANLVHHSYSLPPSKETPEPIWIYSNYTFSNVKRSLDMVSAPRPPDFNAPVTHLSHLMSSGPTLPPGLRFPSGGIIGNQLVIAGTFLGRPTSTFAIWSLDLSQVPKGGKLNWAKIDPGIIMANGSSWNRAVFWRNSVVILGDRDRDIASDYDHRQTNFNHVAFIDLESYGIYNPPLRIMPPNMQEMGLTMLASPAASDFEILCSDGKRLACSRKILQERWPWFRETLTAFQSKTKVAFDSISSSPESDYQSSEIALSPLCVTPRMLELPEVSSIAFAALQYFYTLSLCTPLQHQINVLVGLLLFARKYQVPHLRALAVHGLHGALSATSQNAPACYEVSTLAGAYALQVRSLKRMMVQNSSKRAHESQVSQSTTQGSPATQATSTSIS